MTTVHLLGCLGNGMSELARLYRDGGFGVSGCDERADSLNGAPTAERLRRIGVTVAAQRDCRPEPGTDLVVHSLAVPPGHGQLVWARERGIPVRSRVEALAEFLPEIADHVVAVSGVTGKTTVAGMVAQIYRELGVRPSVYLGGEVDGLPAAGDRLAVVEACEVREGMLSLPAAVAAVTSIYWGEHPASYSDLRSLEAAFGRFAAAARRAVLPWAYRGLAGDAVTFGEEPLADVRLRDQSEKTEGFIARYDVCGVPLRVTTPLRGRHNAMNLGAALACLVAEGRTVDELGRVDFRRVRAPHRRIEPLGVFGGTAFYDDFGHNPMQISAAYEVLRGLHPGRPIGAFLRPRGFERLGAFGMSYADVLRHFDVVYVAPARPTFEDSAATADQSPFPARLVAELRRRGVTAEAAPLSPGVLRGLAGCGAACFFDILPIAPDVRALIPEPG